MLSGRREQPADDGDAVTVDTRTDARPWTPEDVAALVDTAPPVSPETFDRIARICRTRRKL